MEQSLRDALGAPNNVTKVTFNNKQCDRNYWNGCIDSSGHMKLASAITANASAALGHNPTELFGGGPSANGDTFIGANQRHKTLAAIGTIAHETIHVSGPKGFGQQRIRNMQGYSWHPHVRGMEEGFTESMTITVMPEITRRVLGPKTAEAARRETGHDGMFPFGGKTAHSHSYPCEVGLTSVMAAYASGDRQHRERKQRFLRDFEAGTKAASYDRGSLMTTVKSGHVSDKSEVFKFGSSASDYIKDMATATPSQLTIPRQTAERILRHHGRTEPPDVREARMAAIEQAIIDAYGRSKRGMAHTEAAGLAHRFEAILNAPPTASDVRDSARIAADRVHVWKKSEFAKQVDP